VPCLKAFPEDLKQDYVGYSAKYEDFLHGGTRRAAASKDEKKYGSGANETGVPAIFCGLSVT
jgi:hypothetical protein